MSYDTSFIHLLVVELIVSKQRLGLDEGRRNSPEVEHSNANSNILRSPSISRYIRKVSLY